MDHSLGLARAWRAGQRDRSLRGACNAPSVLIGLPGGTGPFLESVDHSLGLTPARGLTAGPGRGHRTARLNPIPCAVGRLRPPESSLEAGTDSSGSASRTKGPFVRVRVRVAASGPPRNPAYRRRETVSGGCPQAVGNHRALSVGCGRLVTGGRRPAAAQGWVRTALVCSARVASWSG